MEKEVDNKLAFLDVLVNNNPLNLQTSAFRKKTFTGLLTNCFSFSSFSYKMGLVRTLVDIVYKINNSWLDFHKDIKKPYPYCTQEPFPCSHCREGHQ